MSTDSNLPVLDEPIRRNHKILGRRSPPYPSGKVIDRTVAGTEPAIVSTVGIAGTLTERDASQMRAHTDDNEPFWALNSLCVCCRVDELGIVIVGTGTRDGLLGSMNYEDRLAPPLHGYPLPQFDGSEVDLGR